MASYQPLEDAGALGEAHDDAFDISDTNTDDGDVSDEDWADDRNIQAVHEARAEGLFSRGYGRIQANASDEANIETRPQPGESSGASGASGSVTLPSGPLSSSSPLPNATHSTRLAALFPWSWRWPTESSEPAAFNNDGVFANLTAKPDSGEGDGPGGEDELPSYEEAAADATPPYWETTIMAPGLGDDVFIDGLPVGSPINFMWNMMVSCAFQFVGFFLTYLLHTSHAAKHGSRAGLGFTFIQCGWYLEPPKTGDMDSSAPPHEFAPSDPNDYNTSPYDSLSGTSAGTSTATSGMAGGADAVPMDGPSVGWISALLVAVGVFLILKSVFDYVRARRMEKAILAAQEESTTVAMEPIVHPLEMV